MTRQVRRVVRELKYLDLYLDFIKKIWKNKELEKHS